MLHFDHAKLITGDLREMSRFRRWLLAAVPGGATETAHVHHEGGACCRREEWAATLGRIHTALGLADVSVANIWMGGES